MWKSKANIRWLFWIDLYLYFLRDTSTEPELNLLGSLANKFLRDLPFSMNVLHPHGNGPMYIQPFLASYISLFFFFFFRIFRFNSSCVLVTLYQLNSHSNPQSHFSSVISILLDFSGSFLVICCLISSILDQLVHSNI